MLAQLSNIIEEQARRRFQQKQQQIQIQQQLQQKYQHGALTSQEIAAPDFTYKFDVQNLPLFNEKIPFAVSPSDPRYYDTTDRIDNNKYQSKYDEDYQELLGKDVESTVINDSDGVPSYKLKAPMEVKPKYNVSTKSRDVKTRDDLKTLVEHLQINGEENAIINNGQYISRSDVIKKHMEMDAAMGMYVVALIAGVSAAVTVGLIALGIGWYT